MSNEVFLAPMSVPLGAAEVDVLSLIADAVICTDEDGRILLYNQSAERTFGYNESEVIGQSIEMLLPHRFRDDHAHQVQSFAKGETGSDRLMGHSREVLGRRKSGEEFPAEATVSRQRVNGRTILTVVHRDISERKVLEEQRDAIARELDHRIRNVFSVVNSLVRLSSRDAESVEEFKESLMARLSAVARNQSALRDVTDRSETLRVLLLAELDQYRTSNQNNLVIEGPPITLRPLMAQSLALVLHELATNSSKYGAFSVDGGRVTVTAALSGEGGKHLLTLEWRETGGPSLKEPERQGFGTALIKQVIGRTLRGEVTFDYERDGLICRMTFSSGFEATECSR